jgi:predicted transcriptional regulator
MNQLKKELQAVKKELNTLSRRAEKIATKLDKLENASKTKAKAEVKAKPAGRKPAAKKSTQLSAPATILGIIKRRKTPIDIQTLRNKTGYNNQKARDALYLLKKRGAIKNPSKGFYVKA